MRISKIVFDALMEAFRIEMFDKDVDLHANKRRGDFCYKFEVNWWAVGSVDPARAIRFASYLAHIALLAEYLNEWEIDIDYRDDEEITSQKKYMDLRDKFREAIRAEEPDALFGMLKVHETL